MTQTPTTPSTGRAPSRRARPAAPAANAAVPARPLAPRHAGRLLLIDGHSMAYRAFFALPVENFSTSTARSRTRSTGSPRCSSTSCATSSPTPSRSRSTSPARPSGTRRSRTTRRTAAPPAGVLRPGALIKEVLAALDVRPREGGYEADDVIATLTTQADGAGFEVLVSCGDRDAMQLVTDRGHLALPAARGEGTDPPDPGGGGGALRRPAGAVPRLAALVGESSDNLPGVPGVGDKTAAKWLTQFGGLDGVIANAGAHRRQGRPEPAREPRGRDPQPPAEPAGRDLELPLRSTTCACAVGPRAGPPGVRRAGVPRAARPAVRHAQRARARGRGRLRPRRRAPLGARRCRWLPPTAPRPPACTSSALGRGPGDAEGVALASADGAAGSYTWPTPTPRRWPRSPAGSPTRPGRR